MIAILASNKGRPKKAGMREVFKPANIYINVAV